MLLIPIRLAGKSPTLPIIPNTDNGAMMLALLVFLAEICVVTIGTIRIIFISRGMKILAPILGFFEVTMWLFAITQIMTKMTDPATDIFTKSSCFLAFAAGFA